MARCQGIYRYIANEENKAYITQHFTPFENKAGFIQPTNMPITNMYIGIPSTPTVSSWF
jgi:hypothetical protein